MKCPLGISLILQAIRLLKKITLILMTPDWCRDEMPVGHHFKSSFLCPLGITLKNFEGNTPSFYARLCLALSGFAC